jgi:hypothetical protein
MKVHNPQKIKSRAGPVIAVLLVCLAIGATVLLANDKKHLRSLFDYFGVAWPVTADIPQPPPAPPDDKKPAVQQMHYPPRFLSGIADNSLSAFARDMRITGSDMCAHFAAGGFALADGGWQASQMDGKIFECQSQETRKAVDGSSDFSSFFLSIRGTASGQINSIRMKLAAPPGDDGKAMMQKLLDALSIMIEQTRWHDLRPAIDHAKQRDTYETINFGISFSLKREFTHENRFNIIVLPTDKTPALKRTRAFFDDATWLKPAASVTPMPLRNIATHVGSLK